MKEKKKKKKKERKEKSKRRKSKRRKKLEIKKENKKENKNIIYNQNTARVIVVNDRSQFKTQIANERNSNS